MRRKRHAALLLPVMVALLAPGPLTAQEAVPTPATRADGWHTLRVAKWSALLLSAGAAVYGLSRNHHADELYRELEQACARDPGTCAARTPDGAYQSPELEQRYQRVLDADGSASTALLASQVGVAATVVLFILDLQNFGAPDDIIYEPRPLRVTPRRDGGVELRLDLRAP